MLLIASVVAVALVTFFAPLERTLGANARFVYLHGAWVWVALLLFAAAGVAGLLGLLLRRQSWLRWSQALGWTALGLWVTFLPQSLLVMQANWNGLFLDEPRFRVPLNYAVVGLLVQVGLAFLPLSWTALGNALFGAALFVGMRGIQTVLHPESPIFQPGTGDIKVFFAALVVLLALVGVQISALIRRKLITR